MLIFPAVQALPLAPRRLMAKSFGGLMRTPLALILFLASTACSKNPLAGEDARRYLKARGIPCPDSASNVRFHVEDNLPWARFLVSFDVSKQDAAAVAEALWCRPAPEDSGPSPSPQNPWFSAKGLTDVQGCDTNGPTQGSLALTATVGITPEGRSRFLLEFSD